MEGLFKSISKIVTSAIDHKWADMGSAIVGTVENGVGLLAKIFGLG